MNPRSAILEVPPAVLRRLATAHPERYPALLDSAVAGPLGKVTILAAQPTAALWRTPDGRVHGQVCVRLRRVPGEVQATVLSH